MQYGRVRISNVLCDLETINKNRSTLKQIQMSMLKMSTLIVATFCQFSQLSKELQFFNCMQNDHVFKAKLFCQKLLLMQSMMRPVQSKM
jgi:hypothetical protein